MKKALFSYLHFQPGLPKFSYFDISKPINLNNSDELVDQEFKKRLSALIKFLGTNKNHCVSIALTSPVMDYLESDSNQLSQFKKLLKDGQLEIQASPAFNSLSALFSSKLFEFEIKEGIDRIRKLFGVTPKGFSNSVLMYSDSMADKLNAFGFSYTLAPRIPWFIENPADVVFISKSGNLKVILADSVDEVDSERTVQVLPFNPEEVSEANTDFILLSELAKGKKTSVYKLPDLVAIDKEGKGIDSLVGNNLQRDFLNRLMEISIAVADQDNKEFIKKLLWIGSLDHFRALSKNVNDDIRYDNYTSLLNLLYDLEIQLR